MNLTEDPFSIVQAITACGVVIWDATDSHIIAANQTAATLLGLQLRTLLGYAERLPQPTLLRPDGTELPWEERPSAVALRTGQAQLNILVDVAYPDGQRWSLRVDAVPVRRNDGMVSWVVVSFVGLPEQAGAGRSGRAAPTP